MESSELTQEQFELIKAFCSNKSIIVFCPHPLGTESQEEIENHDKNLANLQALEKEGFVKNVTEEWKAGMEFNRKQGQRDFDAYALTELAYKMFNPNAEGLPN